MAMISPSLSPNGQTNGAACLLSSAWDSHCPPREEIDVLPPFGVNVDAYGHVGESDVYGGQFTFAVLRR